MAYQKLGFAPRQTLTADAMNHIETGIYNAAQSADENKVSIEELSASLPGTYLTQANAGTLYLTKSSASESSINIGISVILYVRSPKGSIVYPILNSTLIHCSPVTVTGRVNMAGISTG